MEGNESKHWSEVAAEAVVKVRWRSAEGMADAIRTALAGAGYVVVRDDHWRVAKKLAAGVRENSDMLNDRRSDWLIPLADAISQALPPAAAPPARKET